MKFSHSTPKCLLPEKMAFYDGAEKESEKFSCSAGEIDIRPRLADLYLGDTEAGSDVDSHDESSLEDFDTYAEKQDHQFQSTLPDLVQLLLNMMWAWAASARYVTPSNETATLCDMAIETTLPSSPASLQSMSGHDSQLKPESLVDGYFEMACPFYRFDPSRHEKCLQTKQLRCVEDVVTHLQRDHMMPAYCPNCFQTFGSMIIRDCHTRARNCNHGAWTRPDGLNRAQRQEVEECSTHHGTEREKWYWVWDILFPEEKTDESIYLEYGIERQVCMVRDYWDANGSDLVQKYLSNRGLIPPHPPYEEKAMTRFCRIVFKSLLDEVFEQRELYEEDAGDEQIMHERLEEKHTRGN